MNYLWSKCQWDIGSTQECIFHFAIVNWKGIVGEGEHKCPVDFDTGLMNTFQWISIFDGSIESWADIEFDKTDTRIHSNS